MIFMVDFILLAIFLMSAGAFFFFLFQKVPALRAIPEEMVRQSFHVRPSRFHQCAAFCREYLRASRYEAACMLFIEKSLRRMRVWILKIDAIISRLLLRVQERSKAVIEERSNGYWQNLNDWRRQKEETAIPDVLSPPGKRQDRARSIRKIFWKKKE